MRLSQVAEDVFSSRTSIKVVRALIANPSRSFTGRGLAAYCGTPPVRTLEALRRLKQQGLVSVRQEGRSSVWSLVQGHVLHEGLRQWFAFERGLRQSLVDRIRAALAPLTFVRRVILFGSIAREDERPTSDIDLFVLVDHEGNKAAAEKAIGPLREHLRSTFTNPLRPLIYDQREWESKRHLGVVQNIEREGIVVVDKRPVKTEKLERGKARIYLRKAEEFARLMEPSASRGDWNAVGLCAVHAVISASDAITTAKLGVRSRADDHEDVVQLFRELPIPGATAKADQALEVLQVKNQVEYEARDFEEKEAKAARKKAERFLHWVREHVAD